MFEIGRRCCAVHGMFKSRFVWNLVPIFLLHIASPLHAVVAEALTGAAPGAAQRIPCPSNGA
jgi:hypothetical protein